MNLLSLGAIPLYQQINIAVVALSFFILILSCFIGAKQRGLLAHTPSLEQKPSFPLPIDYLWTVVLILFITGMNIINACSTAAPAATEESSTAASWLDPLLFFAIHIPIIIRLIQSAKEKEKTVFHVLQWLAFIFCAFALTFCSNALVQASPLVDWFTESCGSPKIQEALSVFQEHSWLELLPHIITACIIAPVVEECLFRGMLYPCIKKFLTPAKAALLCGLVFGAIHMALPQLLALSVLGAFLCYIYERVKSLWLPIIIHAAFNSFNVLIAIYYEDILNFAKALEEASQHS